MCLATFGSVKIDVERMIIDRVSKFVYKKAMLYNNIICNKKNHIKMKYVYAVVY
jgi:hypothetical protein